MVNFTTSRRDSFYLFHFLTRGGITWEDRVIHWSSICDFESADVIQIIHSHRHGDSTETNQYTIHHETLPLPSSLTTNQHICTLHCQTADQRFVTGASHFLQKKNGILDVFDGGQQIRVANISRSCRRRWTTIFSKILDLPSLMRFALALAKK